MKAEELMIGNWVYTHLHLPFEQRSAVDATMMVDIAGGFIEAKPIPLTEEWLEKFGFEKTSGISYSSGEEKRTNIWRKDKFTYNGWNGWWVMKRKFSGKNLQHVHQLQNLYYALTGEQLTIKL
jgi:hypothetical protein